MYMKPDTAYNVLVKGSELVYNMVKGNNLQCCFLV